MESRKRPNTKSIEILIAEDSPTQAAQLGHLLNERGYAVKIAVNGKQALEAARKGKPTLIISDIMMPEMDGYAFCKAIKTDENLKDIPVIIVTSLSSIQDIVRGLECGADNFIRKPYDPKSLLDRIDYLLLNRELRKGRKMQMGLEVYLAGKKHFITYEREQILDLLVSTYEQAIQVNEELKRREKEVSALNASLEHRARELEAANKELESFSYSVSHDLRAPLRTVDGFARILLDDYAPQLPSEAQRYLRLVRDGAQRMDELVRDLLDFSRVGRQPLRTQPVRLTELLSNCREELRQELEGRQVEIRMGELPACHGDAALLRQMCFNLLSNAVKYTRKQDSAVIEIGSQTADGETVYYIRDNGVGFDMKYADKLFAVFQRLHRAEEYEGTGVGLAIVQRVIHRHGGRVWAESELGKGATFYFTLEQGQ